MGDGEECGGACEDEAGERVVAAGGEMLLERWAECGGCEGAEPDARGAQLPLRVSVLPP